MKTFKTVLLSVMTTTLVLTGVVTGLAYENGIISIDKVEQKHNRIVIEDGEVAEMSDWIETLGYNVSVELTDGTYIGK